MRHALSLQQPLTKEAARDRGMSGARTRFFAPELLDEQVTK
ncbi:MAG: hypothetical protein R3F44_07160 [Candidatus Competibacteraceae bacterium]